MKSTEGTGGRRGGPGLLKGGRGGGGGKEGLFLLWAK